MYIGQKITSWEFHQLTSKGRKSNKALYAPTSAQMKLVDGIYDFYVEQSEHVTFSVTLQTKIVVKREKGLSDKQRINLENDFRIFATRLQRSVWGMAHRRKPKKFSLMLLPTLEGLIFSPEGFRTLHFHVGIGNAPADMTVEKLHKSISTEWKKASYGRTDIKVKPAGEGWLAYITKEVERGNTQCCDWGNSFVPDFSLLS